MFSLKFRLTQSKEKSEEECNENTIKNTYNHLDWKHILSTEI